MSTTKVIIYDNHVLHPVRSKGTDFSKGEREDFHLERKDGQIISVSDGITDYNALIQSHKNEAGLVNIMKLQTLRYGTLDNAIARNKDKQVFADVSNIPDSVAEQKKMVDKANADIKKLCDELGVTKEELLSLTPEKYLAIKKSQADAAAAAAQQAAQQAADSVPGGK